jgi:hypothetical protein
MVAPFARRPVASDGRGRYRLSQPTTSRAPGRARSSEEPEHPALMSPRLYHLTLGHRACASIQRVLPALDTGHRLTIVGPPHSQLLPAPVTDPCTFRWCDIRWPTPPNVADCGLHSLPWFCANATWRWSAHRDGGSVRMVRRGSGRAVSLFIGCGRC